MEVAAESARDSKVALKVSKALGMRCRRGKSKTANSA